MHLKEMYSETDYPYSEHTEQHTLLINLPLASRVIDRGRWSSGSSAEYVFY